MYFSLDTHSIKKIDRAYGLIKKKQHIFKCPVCGGSMSIDEPGRLICKSRHSFDLSRKGYLNLLTGVNTQVYSKELFEARHRICSAGFYDPLIDELAGVIAKYQEAYSSNGLNILDAGCGEGSHIYSVYRKFEEKQNNTFIGIDISKDSINIAARNDAGLIWCVADLAKLPFKNNSLDIVLNILSPANYAEFDRVLKQKGIVIKVAPSSQYLKELREAIYMEEADNYSNEKVIGHFGEKLDIIDTRNISYSFDIDKQLLSDFIKMTPLTWGKSSESIAFVFEKNITSITADFSIMIGRKKNSLDA